MSRKAVLEPIYVTSTQAVPIKTQDGLPVTQSLSASFSTVATSVKFQDNLSYQINITTTNSQGTFQLQGSNDGVSYADLGTAGVVAAANDVAVININQFPFAYMRLHYTSSVAGTGICSIVLMGRSVGA